jgi:hypothetical protein
MKIRLFKPSGHFANNHKTIDEKITVSVIYNSQSEKKIPQKFCPFRKITVSLPSILKTSQNQRNIKYASYYSK